MCMCVCACACECVWDLRACVGTFVRASNVMTWLVHSHLIIHSLVPYSFPFFIFLVLLSNIMSIFVYSWHFLDLASRIYLYTVCLAMSSICPNQQVLVSHSWMSSYRSLNLFQIVLAMISLTLQVVLLCTLYYPEFYIRLLFVASMAVYH